MDQFIKNYQTFIISCFFLVAGMLAAGYSLLYQPLIINSAKASQLSRTIQNETKANKEFLEGSKGVATSSEEQIVTFLTNINKLAENNEVIIRKLVADPEIELMYNLEIIVDYYTFLKFSADLESLDVEIESLELHPYNPGAQPPEHFISFAIIQRNNASEISTDRLDTMKQLARAENLRNPFQRFAKTSDTSGLKIDLTWVYKFAGVGKVAGAYYATIDSTDYEVGDILDGKVVSFIQKDRVLLNDIGFTPPSSADSQYVLKFRPR